MEEYPNTSLVDCVYLTLRMQRWQGRIMSASSQLWPVCSPFAFREPMEMALAAPTDLKVRHRMSRRLIEYQNPKLAALPLAQGYPALPGPLEYAASLLAARDGNGPDGPAGAAAHRGAETAEGFPRPGYPLARIAALEEVHELLRPEQMASRDVYRPDRLRDFVTGVDLKNAGNPECFGRLLTVELTARAVRDAGR